MTETIHDRIFILVQEYGDGKNTVFANKIGTSEGNIRGYIKGIMPKADILEKIVTSLDVNADWLLTGEGKMIKSNNISQSSVGNNNVMVGHDINGNISVEKIHGDNNTHIAGNGNHVNNATTLQQALNEISEQRKLVEKSQQQIDRLLAIIEHMTK